VANKAHNPKPTKRRSSRLSEGSGTRKLDFELTYPGKKAADEIIGGTRAECSRGFEVCRRKTDGQANRIFLGENSGVLRQLLDDPGTAGQVKLIYIDPPFATGGVFESRDGQHAYEDIQNGSQFLEFIRERLILLRELLHAEGSIYVHLDDKMAFAVKIIMDEVFGPANFRNWITRKKSNRKNFTRRQFGNIADYILFYTKTNKYTWNRPYEAWTHEWAKREYQYIEADTGRQYKKVPVHAPGVRNGETGKEWKGKLPPPGKHWQFPPAVLDDLDRKGEIYWSPTGNPRRKIYFDQSKGIPIQDVWFDFKDAHNQNIEVTGYPTEKPVELLRRIIDASSNEGDLVLDCFMGSGTTLVSAEELNRRWIGVDSSIESLTTTLKRFAAGCQPMGDFVNGKKAKQPTLFDHPNMLQTSVEIFMQDGIVSDIAKVRQKLIKIFPPKDFTVTSPKANLR
jgi:adenine-specific DNA-methyltransferase